MNRRVALLCLVTVTAGGLSGLAVVPASATPPATPPAAPSAGPAAVEGELLVGYVTGARDDERSRARGRASAQLAERVVPASSDRREVERVRLPQGKSREQAIAELRSDPAVAYAEPNWVLTTGATATDPYFTSTNPARDLWGMYGDASVPTNAFGSQAGEAWAAGSTGSSEVYVGVIDEGIQLTHPDLQGQVWTNPFDAVDGVDDDGNGYVDDTNGWDFANDDRTVYDGGTKGSLDDHGTHVAGTIGAKMDGKGVVGVNWSTTMISGKFLGRRGGSLSDAVQAVDYFTDLRTRHGLNIVATNNSWGGGGFSQTLLDAIVRGAKANILFIAAAGNSGTDNDASPSYPSGYDTTAGAGYDAVVAVAAIDRTGALASFSQYGATTVDLGAPGVGVWSTTAFNTYSSYNGTSMATPHVTGGAALYASTHRGATAADTRAALLSSVVPTASLTDKVASGGRLNVSGF